MYIVTKQQPSLVRCEATPADALDDARWLCIAAMERLNRMREEREYARRLAARETVLRGVY